MAPLAESSTARIAAVGLFPLIEDQVETVPSSAAKRNCAGVPRTTKSCETGLNTTPLGFEGGAPNVEVGITTAIGREGVPEGSNTPAFPRAFSAMKNGCPGTKAAPQGLSRPESVCCVLPATSETRLT